MLTLESLGEVVDGEGHAHLRVAASVDDFVILDGGDQHADGVVERTLSFVENVRARASKHDGASLVPLAAIELDHFVFSNHDFLDGIAGAERGSIG